MTLPVLMSYNIGLTEVHDFFPKVFRSLHVSMSSRMLSDLLGRLVETVAEQGEDMQGYVTELMLTLESAVDALDSDFR